MLMERHAHGLMDLAGAEATEGSRELNPVRDLAVLALAELGSRTMHHLSHVLVVQADSLEDLRVDLPSTIVVNAHVVCPLAGARCLD